jgi:uncharacterized protein YkwD
MRLFRPCTAILALGMMLLGASLGHGIGMALSSSARPVAHVGVALVPRPVYLPVVAKSARPPVWLPAAGAPWLEWVNYYRALALLPPVTEDPALTDGAQKHAHYMILNNAVEPFELSIDRQGYTPEGAAAAVNSVLLGSTTSGTTNEQALAFWMQGPFHALGLVDPALQRTGFGSDRNPGGALIQMAAALNIVSGLDPNSVPPSLYPVMWPSDGMTVYLRTYTQGTDAPEPLTSCPGYLSPAGLPILLQIGSGSLTTVSVTGSALRRGAASLEHCVFTENTYLNPDSTLQTRGRAVLGTRDAIVLIPRDPLAAGATYTVSLTANGQFYQWSFTAGN